VGDDDMASSRDRDRTIRNNLHRFSKYGVLTARPGYEIKGHQLAQSLSAARTFRRQAFTKIAMRASSLRLRISLNILDAIGTIHVRSWFKLSPAGRIEEDKKAGRKKSGEGGPRAAKIAIVRSNVR
jgi:hypothetical protein